MPYTAEHKIQCKDQNRYLITRQVKVFVNRRGSVVDNSDQGVDISVQCASCGALARWKDIP